MLSSGIALAQAQYKHPLGKGIGFTENSLEVDEGEIKYELTVTSPNVVGISYEQLLRIPKLPHTMPHKPGGDEEVSELTATLKLIPPDDIAITKIEVVNKNDQTITVNGDYGQTVEKNNLLFDEDTVPNAELNEETITITGKKKDPNNTEQPVSFTVYIPIYRIDTLGEHLKFITKKIKEEGQHQNDHGRDSKPNNTAPGSEWHYYFRPQDNNPVRISCISYTNNVVKHGLQKWRGAYEPIINPLIVPQGVSDTSGIAYGHTLTHRDGWKTYYLSKDDTDREDRFDFLGNVEVTDSIKNLDSDPVSQAALTALIANVDYGYLNRTMGAHLGNYTPDGVYDADIYTTGDDIFRNTSTLLPFIGDYGFITLPPAK